MLEYGGTVQQSATALQGGTHQADTGSDTDTLAQPTAQWSNFTGALTSFNWKIFHQEKHVIFVMSELRIHQLL